MYTMKYQKWTSWHAMWQCDHCLAKMKTHVFLPPATTVNVFTPVCDSVCLGSRGCTPPRQTSPGQTLPPLSRTTPRADIPPRRPLQRTVRILLECILVCFWKCPLVRDRGNTKLALFKQNSLANPSVLSPNPLVFFDILVYLFQVFLSFISSCFSLFFLCAVNIVTADVKNHHT